MPKTPEQGEADAVSGGSAAPNDTVRKTFSLPQSAIDRAREALGTTTETETVIQALEIASDLAAFRTAIDMALSQLAGRGGFVDPLAPEPEED